jgi:hypothetical protein
MDGLFIPTANQFYNNIIHNSCSTIDTDVDIKSEAVKDREMFGIFFLNTNTAS